jgi:hypothetical protein
MIVTCPHCRQAIGLSIDVVSADVKYLSSSIPELKWRYDMPIDEFFAALPRCKTQRRVQHVLHHRLEQFTTVGQLWNEFASLMSEYNYAKVAHQWLWQQLTDAPYSERPRR